MVVTDYIEIFPNHLTEALSVCFFFAKYINIASLLVSMRIGTNAVMIAFVSVCVCMFVLRPAGVNIYLQIRIMDTFHIRYVNVSY